MIIELSSRSYVRGQLLKGVVHIPAHSAYTAEKVEVTLVRKGRYRCYGLRTYSSQFCHDDSRKVLYSSENMVIFPPERQIQFEYTISEDVPFTFDSGLVRITWHIEASIKSGFFPQKTSQEFVILPHVLKSAFPVHDMPLPVCRKHSDITLFYKPLDTWRFTGPLHWTDYLTIETDNDSYTPGDTVRGTVSFLKDFPHAHITVYLVFQNKSRHHSDSSEEVHLIAEAHDVGYRGSQFSFSGSIPVIGYPSFATEHMIILWMIRAVVKMPFRFTKVKEKSVHVDPLGF